MASAIDEQTLFATNDINKLTSGRLCPQTSTTRDCYYYKQLLLRVLLAFQLGTSTTRVRQ